MANEEQKKQRPIDEFRAVLADLDVKPKEEQKKQSPVDEFKRTLTDLGLKPTDVFAHKEYTDKIVIVTKAGQKLTWPRAKGNA